MQQGGAEATRHCVAGHTVHVRMQMHKQTGSRARTGEAATAATATACTATADSEDTRPEPHALFPSVDTHCKA